MRSRQQIGGLVLAALCISAMPSVARAQNACGKEWKIPAVGSWAEWSGKEGKTRLSVIDQEDKAGKTLYRVEVGNGGNVMQMVVPSFPWEIDQVEEMVMQQTGKAPMKMSGQMLQMMRSHMPSNNGGPGELAKKCAAMKVVGEESITVPAGTFKATHLKSDSGDEVWASADIPFSVIKYSGKEGQTVLTATGKDAKTALTGTPTEMQMGMPRQ